MYDTKYEITYNSPDIFLETDEVNDKDREFIINVLYRKDLCNIFSIDYELFSEGTAFDEKISELYKIIGHNEQLSYLMGKISTTFFDKDDKELGLMLLLSFDFLHLSHPCFCEFIETGNICSETISKLTLYVEKEMFT